VLKHSIFVRWRTRHDTNPGNAGVFYDLLTSKFMEQLISLMLFDSPTAFALAAFAALLVGIGKTGVPAISLIFTAIMAIAISGKFSIGMVLLLLIIGDAFAVLFYRKHADLSILAKMLPAIAVGLALGTYLLDKIPSDAIRPVLGTVVLSMISLDVAKKIGWLKVGEPHALLGVSIGVVAGITTIVGNAAGPIMAMYFLLLRFDKLQFMGTSSWLFFIVNTSKVPLLWSIDVIVPATFYSLIALLPFTVVGAISGKYILRFIPTELFSTLVIGSALITSSYFIIGYFL